MAKSATKKGRTARRSAKWPRRCGKPGCSEQAIEGRFICPTHAAQYDAIRDDLEAAGPKFIPPRPMNAATLCLDDACTRTRLRGLDYCADHDPSTPW